MIDFNEEIKKYKPVLEIANIEQVLRSEDTQDLRELLQLLKSQLSDNGGN